MYAIQLADFLVLQRDNPVLRIFLADKVSLEPVDIRLGLFDGFVLPFICNDEQAAAIVALLRLHYTRQSLRLYRKQGQWKHV